MAKEINLCDKCKDTECKNRNKLIILEEADTEEVTVTECSEFKK